MAEDIDISRPVDLVVLAVKDRAARCCLLENGHAITLRAGRIWGAAPGQIVTLRADKQWRYSGHPYISGKIEDVRTDAAALGLTPLQLRDEDLWKPEEHYWGEEGEPLEDWAQPIVAWGPRPSFEMEQILPGEDPEDFDSDPIIEANDLKDSGDFQGARDILNGLLEADLRCLDAHAHLGGLMFGTSPFWAVNHYEAGVRIGELSLNPDFDVVLPWGRIDNRPFLRCLQGYGLCLWRLERFDEAQKVFTRMLWLNPSDNQGVRFLLPQVQTRKPWIEEK
jgi:tetratricopeptide (TPR) repeat protein